MVGEHPGRGGNTRLRREEALRLRGNCVAGAERKDGREKEEGKKKERAKEGEREREGGEGRALTYARVSNPQASTILYSAFFHSTLAYHLPIEF